MLSSPAYDLTPADRLFDEAKRLSHVFFLMILLDNLAIIDLLKNTYFAINRKPFAISRS